MMFVDELKQCVGIILHPDKGTKTAFGDPVDAFLFYYKASLIPLAVALIIEMLLSAAFTISLQNILSAIPYIGATIAVGAGLIVDVLLVAVTVLLIWVLVPIGLLLNAVIYHLSGTYLFKIFKNDFDNTLSAFIYSAAPVVVLGWLVIVPLLGLLIFIIAAGWEIVILIYALANLQNATKSSVTWTIFLTGIILGVAGFVLALVGL